MASVPLTLTDEETGKLIELYRSQENLYNSSHKSYYHRDKQRESLRFLCASLEKNWTEDQMRQKLKGIRTQYTRQLQKVRRSEVSGASTDDVYKPAWKFYYSLDAFLRPYCSVWKGISNMADQADQADEADGAEDIDLLLSQTQSQSMDLTMDEPTPSASPVPTTEELPRPRDVSSPRFLHEQKKKKIDVPTEALGLLKKMTEKKPKRQKTDSEVFCNYLARRLGKLSPEDQEIAQDGILDLVRKIENERRPGSEN